MTLWAVWLTVVCMDGYKDVSVVHNQTEIQILEQIEDFNHDNIQLLSDHNECYVSKIVWEKEE